MTELSPTVNSGRVHQAGEEQRSRPNPLDRNVDQQVAGHAVQSRRAVTLCSHCTSHSAGVQST